MTVERIKTVKDNLTSVNTFNNISDNNMTVDNLETIYFNGNNGNTVKKTNKNDYKSFE